MSLGNAARAKESTDFLTIERDLYERVHGYDLRRDREAEGITV